MSTERKLSKRVTAALAARHDGAQWEKLIVGLLHKLELPRDKRLKAVEKYEKLGRHIARKLGLGETDVHMLAQGSMATQTTVSGYGPQKFDLDVVVKLSAPRFANLRESDQFFADFGAALKGADSDAGDPDPKNRCWRLQYPGFAFYFDVTPAIPLSRSITGTDLRVRDKVQIWSPSNPEDLITWFCGIAAKRFEFQRVGILKAVMDRAQVDPVPDTPVAIDDILRRSVQLIKMHRDSYFRSLPDEVREAMPISVILVTLAAKAYDHLATYEKWSYNSAIEVALEVAERLPEFIDRSRGYAEVRNPILEFENFADKWRTDGGLRERQFKAWHARLVADLEVLFSDECSRADEAKIRNIFGQAGVDAWQASQPKPAGVFGGLLLNPAAGNPTRPPSTGSRNTAG
jgi:hypothetical protein